MSTAPHVEVWTEPTSVFGGAYIGFYDQVIPMGWRSQSGYNIRAPACFAQHDDGEAGARGAVLFKKSREGYNRFAM